jgi:hypothetical protein
MAHIYMSFDFGTDEEKAQQARHKLEMWKQAFRLDKKMLYKFERTSADGAAASDRQKDSGLPTKSVQAPPGTATAKRETAKAAKSSKAAKFKEKAELAKATSASENIKLHLRLALPAHERITEERFLKKFPAETPFNTASAQIVRQGQPGFAEADAVFESLD